jgi:hypothetical protein
VPIFELGKPPLGEIQPNAHSPITNALLSPQFRGGAGHVTNLRSHR